MGVKICDQLAQGKSLTEICDQTGYPDRGTVRRWVAAQPDFRVSYESSRLAWADELFEQIVTIADQARRIAEEADAREGNSNAAIAALREEIRAKMWVCARLRPDKYGDRVQVAGDPAQPLLPEPVDTGKLSLMILSILGAAKPQAPKTSDAAAETWRGKPPTPKPLPATVLAEPNGFFGLPPEPEPQPAPPTEAMLREQRRIAERRAGPAFDVRTGQVVRFRGGD